MKKIYISALLALSLSVNAQEQRQANAHVHGVNHAKLILDNNQLLVTYEFPIIQLNQEGHDHDDHNDEHHEEEFFAFLEHLFGHDDHDDHEDHDEHKHKDDDHHDHEAHDDDHHQQDAHDIETKLSQFKNHNTIFVLPSKAQCQLTDFNSEIHLVSSESTHQDVELLYKFNCAQPNSLTEIELSAFDYFQGLEFVFVEAIVNNKAISKKIRAKNGKVAL